MHKQGETSFRSEVVLKTKTFQSRNQYEQLRT